jgi:PEP-CTERM motif
MRAKSGKKTMQKRLAAFAAMTTALGALGLVTAAHAATVAFVPYGNDPPPGATLVTDFATLAGDTGTASLFTGSDPDDAAPAFSSTTRDTASYLAVQGGESETLVLPAALDVNIYVGSLDPYNTISFGGPGAVSYTGDQLVALATNAIDNGDQQSGSSNGLFEFSFAAPVSSVTFTSYQNALEVAGVSVSSAVPEPSTWAMMLLGFAGLGYAAYRKTKTERMAFA